MLDIKALMTCLEAVFRNKMFTILCKLSAQNKEFRFYGSHFFTPPVPCILNAVEQMKTENKFQYVSLVLLMVNQNKLS